MIRIALLCVAALWLVCPAMISAKQIDIAGPPGSSDFGTQVTVLPNGNMVFLADDGVYLYDPEGTLISTLGGDGAGVGSVVAVGDSNFVVVSPVWSNGPTQSVGAVTWVDGKKGLSGVISPSNSLVGSSAYDKVGMDGVVVLKNGNYVVSSPWWNAYQGAVTWANGNSAISGVVSVANSLVGLASGAQTMHFDIVPLNNGNYVVGSTSWSDYRGVVTWGSGTSGIAGTVSSSNSVVGSSTNDQIGNGGIAALANGNYVVSSTAWNSNLGAVTWSSGLAGLVGEISAVNSLIGSVPVDQAGSGGIVPLSNGNYIVGSPSWNNGRGAVTWGSGDTGIAGEISVANSLIGAAAGEGVGYRYGAMAALSNGNYVVASPSWGNLAGAVAWGNGATGTVGEVSAGNSMVGSVFGDQVGNGGITALDNGNYIIGSYYWNQNRGASTWADGSAATTGTISASNSLVGAAMSEWVGFGGVISLSNGDYVVGTPRWNAKAGAATWANGTTGINGEISSANSVVGTVANDYLSVAAALENGNYVINSYNWNNNAGAVRLGKGLLGTTGTISAENSLIGSPGDQVGFTVIVFDDGNYAVLSPYWNEMRGAVTLASGAFPLIGTIQPWNSVMCAAPDYGFSLSLAYDTTRHRLVVGRRGDNMVSLFTMDQVFADRFE